MGVITITNNNERYGLTMTELEKTIKEADNQWLSTDEAAVYVGLSVSRLANLRSDGQGAAYSKPNNGKVLYLRSDLDKWIKGEK